MKKMLASILLLCIHFLSDFAIWSRVEITNFDYHINFTEPSTSEFTQITKIIEKEVNIKHKHFLKDNSC